MASGSLLSTKGETNENRNRPMIKQVPIMAVGVVRILYQIYLREPGL